MHVKTYRAASMPEALRMIRRELGSDAAVVKSRCVRLGGWIGLLSGKRGVEVTASSGVFTANGPVQRRALLEQGIDLSGPAPPNLILQSAHDAASG
jgi:flagellar biosynthesis protein FlhF